jgi:YidC/Oxa1 family membrane protein insertase
MDRNQRNMMLVLPLVFVLFIIRFPAGLIVYWITTNAWTMVQQYTIKAFMGPMPAVAGGVAGEASAGGAEPVVKQSGGTGSRTSETGEAKQDQGGLGGLLRGRGPRGSVTSGNARTPSDSGADVVKREPPRRTGGPPPSARAKKKRSGRRR